ncbi:hypothetical protein [Terriglobus sp. ADX1]|uniref:hypothetical protein n=1 Tax=Terriglobus sp. ADX1 TaxID=2794063 RepID=UPI002FE55900
MNDSKPTASGKQNPVNPPWHHEFEVLCSLYPSGELTEEEWALLQIHLAYCQSCTALFEQYQHLAENVMPRLAAESFLQSEPEPHPIDMKAAEDRLLRTLEATPAIAQSATAGKRPKSLPWKLYVGLLAASLAGVAAPFAFRWAHPSHASMSTVKNPPSPIVNSQPAPDHTVSPNTTDVPQQMPDPSQRDVARLQSELMLADARWKESASTAASAKEQLESEQRERTKIAGELDMANQQLAAARSETQSLRDNISVSATAANQQAWRINALEARLRQLNASAEEKDRMLALDKEFLSHDREIRDLIAARNLYIADIYDVAQNGKTAKPFGRIFYTKDRSLVFYGYDLDKQSGLKQAVAFQAWGSGEDKKNVSLGLFYQDESHKRWVLQFNDTKTLARLNMVFVTAEPQGGSTKPTGKPVLLAYLQVQPNHP